MLVLYEGRAIAFGPSEEVFARVRNVNEPGCRGEVGGTAVGKKHISRSRWPKVFRHEN